MMEHICQCGNQCPLGLTLTKLQSRQWLQQKTQIRTWLTKTSRVLPRGNNYHHISAQKDNGHPLIFVVVCVKLWCIYGRSGCLFLSILFSEHNKAVPATDINCSSTGNLSLLWGRPLWFLPSDYLLMLLFLLLLKVTLIFIVHFTVAWCKPVDKKCVSD